MMVCLKKMLNAEKIVLLKLKGLIQIAGLKKNSGLKKIAYFYHPPQSSFRTVAPNIAIGLDTKYIVAIKKRIESLYFPEEK